MDRRGFLAASTLFALASPGTPRAADDPQSGPAALFGRWLSAFNSSDPAAYRALIATAMPDALAYVDDDLAVREASGGFDLVRTAATGPQQVTAWVKDRNWDRFSKVVLTAKDERTIADVAFFGASPPVGFTLQRLGEQQALRRFDRKLAAEAQAGRFAGAALVARRGRVLFRRAYGLADIAGGRRADIATRYCIGSMGKMFTAVSILQLVQAGRVGLDDPLARHLPDYPNPDLARRVTIAHLLTHTGGTGDIFGPSYDGRAALRPSDFIRLNGQRGPAFEPGTKWSYSNYGFVLLGAVIEHATGKAYEDWYQAHIFIPAGMTSTSQNASVADTAIAYTGATGSGLRAMPANVGVPAGGGYSTVEDLHAFSTAIRSHKLLDAQHVKLMLAGRVDAGSARQALGFVIKQRNGLPCYGHGGSAEGVNGDLAVFPRSGYETIVLCNRGYPVAVNAAEYVGARLPAA